MEHQVRDRSASVGEDYALERGTFLPLPPVRYDAARTVESRVNSKSRVPYRSNWYSVPAAYAYRRVQVKGYADRVCILCDGREVASHERLFGRGKKQMDPLHYVPLLVRKPHALDHAEAFRGWNLPKVFDRFRTCLEEKRRDGLQEYVAVLQLLRSYSVRKVAEALEVCLEQKVVDHHAVILALRLREQQDRPGLLSCQRWASVSVPVPDVRQYENLIREGG